MTLFFGWGIHFDRMITSSTILLSKIINSLSNTIFLILSNVKIPSPLERFKMKRDELFSKNGDSVCIFWRLCEMWNSVSFWNGSFTFIYFRWRVLRKKLLSFQIFSALSSHFQRAAILFAAQWIFSHCALRRKKQCAEKKQTVGNGEKDCLFRLKC